MKKPALIISLILYMFYTSCSRGYVLPEKYKDLHLSLPLLSEYYISNLIQTKNEHTIIIYEPMRNVYTKSENKGDEMFMSCIIATIHNNKMSCATLDDSISQVSFFSIEDKKPKNNLHQIGDEIFINNGNIYRIIDSGGREHRREEKTREFIQMKRILPQ